MDAAWSSPAVWRRSASDAQQPVVAARTPPPTAAHGVTVDSATGSEASRAAISRHSIPAPAAAHCMPEEDAKTPVHSGGPPPRDDEVATTADPLQALTEAAARQMPRLSAGSRRGAPQRTPAMRSPEAEPPLPGSSAASEDSDEETAGAATGVHEADSVTASLSTSPEPQHDLRQHDAAKAASAGMDTATHTPVPITASPSTPVQTGGADSADDIAAADVWPAAGDEDASASVRYAMAGVDAFDLSSEIDPARCCWQSRLAAASSGVTAILTPP